MLQYRYLYPLTPHVPCKNMERKNCSKEFFNWSDPPPPPTSFQSTNCESSPWPVPFNIVDIPDTQQEFQIPKLSKNFKSQNSARISNSKTQQEFRIPKLSKNFESQNTPTKVKFAVVRIQSTNFTECSTTSMTFYMNNKLLSSVLVIWVMRQMITTEIQMTITAKI